MVRVNNIFTGKIDGVTPYERYGQIGRLDRNQGALKNRMKNINEIIENDDFFMDYFDEYYNPVLNNDSALSEENNICQMLSSMADYLINSDESRKMEEANKTEYVFTDDVFERKNKRHEERNGFQNDDEIENKNIQYIKNKPNVVKFRNDKLKITKKDRENDTEMSRILNEYNLFSQRVAELSKQDYINKRRYSTIKSSILDDMKLVKESYLGIFPHSKKIPHGHYLKPIPSPDYSNIKVFRSMINSSPVGLEENYESWENYYDFGIMLNDMFYQGYLDYEELSIIHLRMHGFEYKEILTLLNINYYTNNDEKHLRTNVILSMHRKMVKYLEEK